MTEHLADLPLAAGRRTGTTRANPTAAPQGVDLPGGRSFGHPGKRAFDLVVGTFALLVAAPLIALVALVLLVVDGRPVLYRQQRVGLGGRSFTMVKLRTMVVGADRMVDVVRDRDVTDGLLFKVLDDPRVTRLGALLRRTCLDELPQLWNVVRGEMSLVGPRPLAVDPALFSTAQHERHRSRPGITGRWQLSGGPRRSFEEMIRLDLDYLRTWSLRQDLAILLRTVPAIMRRRDHA